MEFMGFHIVDIIIVSLVAFLAIKGLVNGLAKELLNFIVVVVGILLAARYNTMVVQAINEQNLIPKIEDNYAEIVGFILIVVAIWLLISFLSSIFSRLISNPRGFLSRLLGYILSAVRYVFIFSLIIFGINQAEFFEKSATKFKAETQLFQPMSEWGAYILNKEINQTVVTENNLTKIKDLNISTVKVSEKNATDINSSVKASENNVSKSENNVTH